MRLTAGGRQLATAALVQALGVGLYLASSIAFFTRQVGLTANEVAGGLATAGVIALAVSLLGGLLADRYGARRVLVVLFVGRGLCFFTYAFVGNLWQFIAVTLVSVAFDRASPPVLQALIATAISDQRERTRLLAVVNVLRNCGLGVGALAAGITLTVDSVLAYRATMITVTLAFFVGAVLVLRVRVAHEVPPRPAKRPEKRSVVPYKQYLVLTALNFVLSFFDVLLLVAMPLWVLEHTDAPRATVSVLFALNTALVVVFQIPVSKLANGLRRTSRMVTGAGVALAGSSACFAVSGGSVGWQAIGWLVLAVVALSLGEVAANSGTWSLSIELAPEHARGWYLSVFNLSLAGERVLGPIIVTGLLLSSGTAGWIGAAVVFVLAGLAAERVALSAAARRQGALAHAWARA
jgi:MFS family permease